jgi:hypothetical protein
MKNDTSKPAFQIPKIGEVWTYRGDKVIVVGIIDPHGYNTQIEYYVNGSPLRATLKEFNRWYNPPEIADQQEQPRRIPKPGEVWRNRGDSIEVVNVYPDAVTYRYGSPGLLATTLDSFLGCFTPPEPTVISSRWLHQHYAGLTPLTVSTHRLDYMSDGEYRLVKL